MMKVLNMINKLFSETLVFVISILLHHQLLWLLAMTHKEASCFHPCYYLINRPALAFCKQGYLAAPRRFLTPAGSLCHLWSVILSFSTHLDYQNLGARLCSSSLYIKSCLHQNISRIICSTLDRAHFCDQTLKPDFFSQMGKWGGQSIGTRDDVTRSINFVCQKMGTWARGDVTQFSELLPQC